MDGRIVYSTVRRRSATMPRGRIIRTFNGLRSVDDNAGAILRQLVVKELFPGGRVRLRRLRLRRAAGELSTKVGSPSRPRLNLRERPVALITWLRDADATRNLRPKLLGWRTEAPRKKMRGSRERGICGQNDGKTPDS